MSGFDLEKFRTLFFDECNMLLDRMENELLELVAEPENKDTLESVFRAMHTIKGTSGMYGFTYINEFTHLLENIYQMLRDGKLKFNKDISEVSLSAIDHMRRLLSDEFLANPTNIKNHKTILSEIESLTEAPSNSTSKSKAKKTVAKDSTATWLIVLHTDEHMSFRGINLLNIFEELATIGTYKIDRIKQVIVPNTQTWIVNLTTSVSYNDISDIFLFVDENVTIVKLHDGVVPPESEDKTGTPVMELIKEIKIEEPTVEKEKIARSYGIGAATSKRIMVDSEKLDYLMYLVSQLVTENSVLIQDVNRLKDPLLKEHIEKHSDLSSLFRQSVLDLRLVPLNNAALRFQRLIHDLAGKLEKKIEFKTEGIDIELDKNTIDALSEPLMHLIRNCIDHGIEKPEKRLAAGKPETGTITLSVVQGGSNVYIHIKDNGGGINKDFVRNKAIEKGLIKESDELTDKELYDLIFLPGFSTAQSLTDVSGRGVGMDVVKQKSKDLRGEVTIESEMGVGSTFSLKIPQSLNIIDSLLFKVGDSNFIVPLLEVQECEQIRLSDFLARENTGTIPYNNQLISFIDLRGHLKIEGNYRPNVKTIIVNHDNQLFALLVDSIVGEHQAVIRQINKRARTLPIFNASSQLGDGRTALMIDTGLLKEFCSN